MGRGANKATGPRRGDLVSDGIEQVLAQQPYCDGGEEQTAKTRPIHEACHRRQHGNASNRKTQSGGGHSREDRPTREGMQSPTRGSGRAGAGEQQSAEVKQEARQRQQSERARQKRGGTLGHADRPRNSHPNHHRQEQRQAPTQRFQRHAGLAGGAQQRHPFQPGAVEPPQGAAQRENSGAEAHQSARRQRDQPSDHVRENPPPILHGHLRELDQLALHQIPMPGVGRQRPTFAQRHEFSLADLRIEACGHFAETLLEPHDVGLLEVQELGQILHRTQKRGAGVCRLGSLSTHELALPLQREAVATQRRQAGFEARSLVVELLLGFIEDRYGDRVIADQVSVEVELIGETNQLEIADTNGAADDRVPGLELQEAFARRVWLRFRPGCAGLVVEPQGVVR